MPIIIWKMILSMKLLHLVYIRIPYLKCYSFSTYKIFNNIRSIIIITVYHNCCKTTLVNCFYLCHKAKQLPLTNAPTNKSNGVRHVSIIFITPPLSSSIRYTPGFRVSVERKASESKGAWLIAATLLDGDMVPYLLPGIISMEPNYSAIAAISILPVQE